VDELVYPVERDEREERNIGPESLDRLGFDAMHIPISADLNL
jgi:hypothetical protein